MGQREYTICTLPVFFSQAKRNCYVNIHLNKPKNIKFLGQYFDVY